MAQAEEDPRRQPGPDAGGLHLHRRDGVGHVGVFGVVVKAGQQGLALGGQAALLIILADEMGNVVAGADKGVGQAGQVVQKPADLLIMGVQPEGAFQAQRLVAVQAPVGVGVHKAQPAVVVGLGIVHRADKAQPGAAAVQQPAGDLAQRVPAFQQKQVAAQHLLAHLGHRVQKNFGQRQLGQQPQQRFGINVKHDQPGHRPVGEHRGQGVPLLPEGGQVGVHQVVILGGELPGQLVDDLHPEQRAFGAGDHHRHGAGRRRGSRRPRGQAGLAVAQLLGFLQDLAAQGFGHAGAVVQRFPYRDAGGGQRVGNVLHGGFGHGKTS